MSKAHLLVLGFLKEKPMYGYQISQIIESRNLNVFAGIKLSSIYKAMQSLEQHNYITGEQVTEGNNPPRTVYQITQSGKKYLRELAKNILMESVIPDRDFWLALPIASKILDKETLLNGVEHRLQSLVGLVRIDHRRECESLIKEGKLPPVHKYIFEMGDQMHRIEVKTLNKLKEAIEKGEFEIYHQAEEKK